MKNHARIRATFLIGFAIVFLTACSIGQNTGATSTPTPLPPPQSLDLGTFGNGAARDMTWSQDGKMLAVESSAGGYIYDTSSWNLVATIPTDSLEDGRPGQLTFSPDQKHLLFVSGYQKVFWQYDLRTNKVSRIYENITDEPFDKPFYSPDGRLFAFGSLICKTTDNNSVCRQALNLYNAGTGELIHRLPENGLDQGEDMSVFAFSPDGQWVATGGKDDVVRVWDVASGILKYKLQQESDVYSLSFSPESNVLVSAGLDAALRFWDMKTGNSLYVLHGTVDEFYQNAAYMDGGRKLLVNYYDGKFKEYSIDEHFLPTTSLDVKIETEKRLMTQMGQYTPELVIRIDPDGKRMALLVNGNVQIWDLQSGRKTYTLPEFIREVYAIGFSPDEKMLAVADHNVHLWQIQPKQFIGTLEVNGGQVMDIAFHPDGRQAAFALAGGNQVEIWDLSLQRRIRTLDSGCSNGDITYSPNAQVAYSPDGSKLAFAASCMIELTDAKTGAILEKFQNELGTSAGLSFNSDGNILIYVSVYGRAAWDLNTGRQLYSIKQTDDYQAHVALSPNLVITTKWDAPLYFFDSISGKRLYEFPQGKGSNVIALSRDGRLLALDNYNRISLLDSTSGAELLSMKFGLPYTMAFSPNGKFLAARSHQENVHLWEISRVMQYAEYSPQQTATPNVAITPTLQPTATPAPTLALSIPSAPAMPPASSQAEHVAQMQKLGELGMGRVNTMAWSPDGKLVAVGGQGVYIFESGKIQPAQFLPARGDLVMLQFSPDGQYLAGQISNEAIQLWNVQSGKSLHVLEDALCWNQSMKFSADNEFLMADCGDVKYTWSVASGLLVNQEKQTLKNNPISGHYTLQVGMQNIRLIDSISGEIIKTFEIPGMAPSLARFSPDGKTLAIWHYQYEIARTGVYYPGKDLKTTLQLWNIFPDQPPTLRTELVTGRWHQNLMFLGEFQGLAFSPDSRMLATASGDGMTQVWDVSKGQLLDTLPNGTTIYFSPDNKYLATLDNDSARMWNISSSSPRIIWEISGFDRWVYTIAFAQNGKELVSVTDEYYKFFNLANAGMTAPVRQIKLPGIRGHNLAVSPDGSRMAYNTSEGILVGENNTENPNWQMLVKFPELLTYDRDLDLTFSPDGSLLASYEPDDKKRIWNLKTKKAVELEDPASTPHVFVSRFLFSPDGTLLFGADPQTSKPSTMYLWDVRTGKLVRQWTAQFYQFAFHPTQPLFVGVDYMSGTVQFFDLRTGNLSREMNANPYVQSLAFSPDGGLLALGYEDTGNGNARTEVRDADTLALLKEIPGGFGSMVFSQDGTMLAIGMNNGGIEYWGWRGK